METTWKHYRILSTFTNHQQQKNWRKIIFGFYRQTTKIRNQNQAGFKISWWHVRKIFRQSVDYLLRWEFRKWVFRFCQRNGGIPRWIAAVWLNGKRNLGKSQNRYCGLAKFLWATQSGAHVEKQSRSDSLFFYQNGRNQKSPRFVKEKNRSTSH